MIADTFHMTPSAPAGQPNQPKLKDANTIRHIADAIERSFRWDETPQGAFYWIDVVRHLRDLAR